jgi:hypothetical protein
MKERTRCSVTAGERPVHYDASVRRRVGGSGECTDPLTEAFLVA